MQLIKFRKTIFKRKIIKFLLNHLKVYNNKQKGFFPISIFSGKIHRFNFYFINLVNKINKNLSEIQRY